MTLPFAVPNSGWETVGWNFVSSSHISEGFGGSPESTPNSIWSNKVFIWSGSSQESGEVILISSSLNSDNKSSELTKVTNAKITNQFLNIVLLKRNTKDAVALLFNGSNCLVRSPIRLNFKMIRVNYALPKNFFSAKKIFLYRVFYLDKNAEGRLAYLYLNSWENWGFSEPTRNIKTFLVKRVKKAF